MSTKSRSPFQDFFEYDVADDKKSLAIITPSKYEDFLVVTSLSEDIPSIHRAFFLTLLSTGATLVEILDVSKGNFKWLENGEQKALTVILGKGENKRTAFVNPMIQDFVWNSIKDRVGRKLFGWPRSYTNVLMGSHFGVKDLRVASFRESTIRYLISIKGIDTMVAGKLLGMSEFQTSKHAPGTDISSVISILSK